MIGPTTLSITMPGDTEPRSFEACLIRNCASALAQINDAGDSARCSCSIVQ